MKKGYSVIPRSSRAMMLVLLGALFLNASLGYAEIIKLKNGRVFDGDITERTEDYIKFYYSGVVLKYHLDEIASISTQESQDTAEPADITTGDLTAPDVEKTIRIGIHPMIELDFRTKREIYSIRKQYVLEHPELITKEYAPSDDVFGQIIDSKPWWGILGLSYYGPGQRGIEGLSEESRFLANPFLLIGLDGGHALIVSDSSLAPIPLYPEPISLVWHKDLSQGKVKYKIGSYWSKLQRYHDPTANTHELTLIAYNARDLGFNYLAIDTERSKNAGFSMPASSTVPIRQFIHCGGSCGYPGGCNNMSPDQADLKVKIYNLPALLYIKLWRGQPAQPGQAADMAFIIEMQ